MAKLAEELASSTEPRKPKKHVHILDDHGSVDIVASHLSKSGNEEIEWSNGGKDPSRIVFDKPEGSPFLRPGPFIVPPGGSTPSGPLDPAVQENERYKYTVIGSKGPNDPVVIIDP